MKYDPQKHHRRSIRLKDYDYSQAGAYYVTINIQNRIYMFGDIVNHEMFLNEAGKMIDEQWIALPQRYSNLEMDVYQIMPNHFHGITVIVGAAFMAAPSLVVAHDVERKEFRRIG
jgi:putative transposase